MASESGTALVTDSTASLTAEDRERLDISVVSLYVILNGENQITGVDFPEYPAGPR